jgi:hypothetical protein
MIPAKSLQRGHFPKCKVIFLLVLIETLTLGPVLGVSININDLFSPTLKSANLDIEETNECECDKSVSCIKLSNDKSADKSASTLIWRYPDTNKGDMQGRDLTGMRRLSFSVRGERVNEGVDFAVGRQQGNFMDSASISPESKCSIKSDSWTPCEINLEGQDLSNIRAGFVCTLTDRCTIYLRDIKYETY